MLRIPRALYEEVLAHCRRQYPKEACGLLAGRDGRVSRVYPMRNVDDSPIGYSMDPREQFQAERAMRLAQEALLGIYHSHTATDAYPSSVDVRLAISPEVSYVLVSLKQQPPDVKSYRIDGTTITPEPHTVE
jgi:proteasome lid subunit RPN8/RPN11